MNKSRQVVRAYLRNLQFDRMGPKEKHGDKPMRKERRKLARAHAAGSWNGKKVSI